MAVRRMMGDPEDAGEQRVRVPLGDRSYDVVIGTDLLERVGELEGIAGLLGERRVFIATDRTVWDLHGAALERGLRQAGAAILGHWAMQPGEPNKHLGSLSEFWDALLGAGIERGDLLVALGGGVVGDVAGFAAATCLRGIEFLQVPTTLLAMVDSSVGGKTGIDHARGKNLIGAFHQPVGVVADLDLLGTLPHREMVSGLAEVVKAALLGDAELFGLLETRGPRIYTETMLLTEAVRRSVELKARVVEADEREGGQRALLNLGHTLGHALEVTSGYGSWTHGEAVAAGIAFAARLSERLGLLTAEVNGRILTLLGTLEYPVRLSGIDVEKVVESMRFDKKSRDGSPRWVLLRDIGDGLWGKEVPLATVRELLTEA